LKIEAAQIKELRDKSGAGVMDCRQALIQCEGDFEKAFTLLKQKGIEKAEKKKDRIAKEGKIDTYIHGGGKIGVLIDVRCETDFVAKTEDFKNLVKELAMQIAAQSPLYVSREAIPAEVLKAEEELYRKAALTENKPPQVTEKIVAGKLDKYFKQVCLLEQPYIRDENIKVADLVKETIGKLGENIIVKRFVRFSLQDE
jgi:elongation factor Ts